MLEHKLSINTIFVLEALLRGNEPLLLKITDIYFCDIIQEVIIEYKMVSPELIYQLETVFNTSTIGTRTLNDFIEYLTSDRYFKIINVIREGSKWI